MPAKCKCGVYTNQTSGVCLGCQIEFDIRSKGIVHIKQFVARPSRERAEGGGQTPVSASSSLSPSSFVASQGGIGKGKLEAMATCPVCGIELMPLSEAAKINRHAAETGRLHEGYDVAGYTFSVTQQNQHGRACHVCSALYGTVHHKTYWIDRQAEFLATSTFFSVVSDPFWRAAARGEAIWRSAG